MDGGPAPAAERRVAFAAAMQELARAMEHGGVALDEDILGRGVGRAFQAQDPPCRRGARWVRFAQWVQCARTTGPLARRAWEFDRALCASEEKSRRARVEFAHELAVALEGRLPREIIIQIYLGAVWE